MVWGDVLVTNTILISVDTSLHPECFLSGGLSTINAPAKQGRWSAAGAAWRGTCHQLLQPAPTGSRLVGFPELVSQRHNKHLKRGSELEAYPECSVLPAASSSNGNEF